MKQANFKIQRRMRCGLLPTARFFAFGDDPHLLEVSFGNLSDRDHRFTTLRLGVELPNSKGRVWFEGCKLSLQRAPLVSDQLHGFALLFFNTSFLPIVVLRWEYVDFVGFVFDVWLKAGKRWSMAKPFDVRRYSRV